MQPIIIPSIIVTRWKEAHARPTIQRWRSIMEMCSSMWVNCTCTVPESPMCDDLRMLCDLAYAHMVELQPIREREAA